MIAKDELTDRQRVILEFIREFTDKHEFAPTTREIAAGMGIRSTNGVMCHLVALERKGRITWNKNHARTLRIVEPESGEDTLYDAMASLLERCMPYVPPELALEINEMVVKTLDAGKTPA